MEVVGGRRDDHQDDFGDPVNADEYVLCLYDGTGHRATLRASRGCLLRQALLDGGDRRASIYYKSRNTTPNGIARLQLRAGASGRAKIQVKGQGFFLPSSTSHC